MIATKKGVFQAFSDDLHRRRPTRRHLRRRHVDNCLPIDLRYNGGFHRPPGTPGRFADAASRSFGADPLTGVFGGPAPYTVEAFEDEEPDLSAVIYGAGQLEDEEEPGGYDEEAENGGAGAAVYFRAASRSISFSNGDDADAVGAPVWGTGELEGLEGPEPQFAGSGAAEPDAVPPPPPVDSAAAPAPGGADLAAGTYRRIAKDTDDPETMAFANDLQAILGGQKAHPSTVDPAAATQPGDDEPLPPYDRRPIAGGFTHGDFDRWGQASSLSAPTSYQMGTFDLSSQFDAFDSELDAAERRRSRPAPGIETAPPMTPREQYHEDLTWLRQSPAAVPPARPAVAPQPAPIWPATPAPIAQPRAMSDEIPLDPGVGGMSINESALEIGDIILSTTTDVSSGIIRAGTGSPVSHSIIYVGGGQVVEAVAQGVVFRSLADAVAGSNLAVAFRKPDLTPEQALIVRDFVGQQIGKEYNKIGVVRQATFQLDRRVFCSGKTGDELERCLNWVGAINLGTSDNSTFYCSELVVAAFAHAGSPLTSRPPNWASPGDLAELRLSGRLSYVGHLKAPVLSR